QELKSEKNLTLTVYKEIHFSTIQIIPAVNGIDYNQKIKVSEGSGNYIISASWLPKGLSIAENGIISGIPEDTPKQSIIELTVIDTAFPKKRIAKEYTFSLYHPIVVETETLPFGCTGNDYSSQIHATGGSGDFLFSSNQLPPGLILSESGMLTGKIESDSGQHSFIIFAVDASNQELKSEKNLTLTVYKEIHFSTIQIIPAVNGIDYNQKIKVSEGSGNYI
ncbi:MAG: hypothetical protein GY800_03050, partial [Planctomycetes bacterium]|nr:hypothetical protein [Planctomycetota bacterium]